MPNEKLRAFFDKMEAQGIKLAYPNVHMLTDHSDVMPGRVSLRTRFTRNIKLNIPVASSPMDTVTNSAMAIAMAEAGGIGIIPRSLKPDEQAKEVGRVKRRMRGRVETPTTVQGDMTVEQFYEWLRQKPRTFHTFPVLDGENKLIGLLTRSDLEFSTNTGSKLSDIMTSLHHLTTAKPDISLEDAYRLCLNDKKKVLPLLIGTDELAGMMLFSDLKRICSGEHSSCNLDPEGQLVVGAAVGTGDTALQRAELLAHRKCDVFQIDTAHGDSGNVIETIQRLKNEYPNIDVIAGNVSRRESALRLVDAGADGVLVGQGPGAICTTRIVAGVGVPQVSAIYDCAAALEQTGVPVCGDGGITYSGDAAVCLAVGASVAMVGKFLAGTDEAPGEIVHYQGRMMKSYRGMGSLGALRENASSQDRYKQTGARTLIPEGVEGLVDYQGPVRDVIEQLIGGVRLSMGYLGAENLDVFRQRAELLRIVDAGASESHPHGIVMAKDAPNYKRP